MKLTYVHKKRITFKGCNFRQELNILICKINYYLKVVRWFDVKIGTSLKIVLNVIVCRLVVLAYMYDYV